MSKGDTYRPVDREKYQRNYLRIFGDKCPRCWGTGNVASTIFMDGTHPKCHYCKGVGFVERTKREQK